MSRAIHFIAKSVPGHAPPDGTGLPCQGVSGRAVCLTPYLSCGSNKNSPKVKHLQCTVRNTSPVCSASSGGHRRNPDFSRQNKHGFSRNRNRQSEDREGFESLEESEMFSSKNGPLLTTSGIPRFQATATPGPREKEIVELFRKVQAQLRERAAVKEERKIEESQRKGKESETVDSLLKLLRKHSVQQGKRSSDIESGRDFILDQPDQNGEKNTEIYDSNQNVKHKKRESEAPAMSRPRSNFQRRSPVPLAKTEPGFSDEDAISSVSQANSVQEGKKKSLEPEFGVGPDTEPTFSDGDVFDEMSEDEISGIYDDDNENVQEPDADEYSNLSEMKLTELRELAKSRGLRGFSKLKKHELIELLSGG